MSPVCLHVKFPSGENQNNMVMAHLYTVALSQTHHRRTKETTTCRNLHRGRGRHCAGAGRGHRGRPACVLQEPAQTFSLTQVTSQGANVS